MDAHLFAEDATINTCDLNKKIRFFSTISHRYSFWMHAMDKNGQNIINEDLDVYYIPMNMSNNFFFCK